MFHFYMKSAHSYLLLLTPNWTELCPQTQISHSVVSV